VLFFPSVVFCAFVLTYDRQFIIQSGIQESTVEKRADEGGAAARGCLDEVVLFNFVAEYKKDR